MIAREVIAREMIIGQYWWGDHRVELTGQWSEMRST